MSAGILKFPSNSFALACIFVIYNLTLSADTWAQEAGAAVIAFCEETGDVGVGYAGGDDPSLPQETLGAVYLADATERAVGNCLAAGGLHGCCMSDKATATVGPGYTQDFRCLSGATVKLSHPPLEELGGATSLWGIRYGHGPTQTSAAKMAMRNCLRTVEGGGAGSRHRRIMSIGEVEVTVEKACRAAATVCLR